MTVENFYDQLAPFYHLIFPDWEASIHRQAAALDEIMRDHWGGGEVKRKILDVACGIGTQALGLAGLGHVVTACDISSAAVERAKREAAQRSLSIELSTEDMRLLPDRFREQFDLVIACDNAVPHLLSDGEILRGFEQMFVCARRGGGCLVTVRDYDREERSGVQVKPYGIRTEGDIRYLVFQVWEFAAEHYDLAMYFVKDCGGPSCAVRPEVGPESQAGHESPNPAQCSVQVMRSRYYAVGTAKLMALMKQAGFRDVQRIDERFYQPVLLGKKP